MRTIRSAICCLACVVTLTLIAGCGHGQRGARARTTTTAAGAVASAKPSQNAEDTLRALIRDEASKTFKIVYTYDNSTVDAADTPAPGQSPVPTDPADATGAHGTSTVIQQGSERTREDLDVVADYAPDAGHAVITTILQGSSAIICTNEIGSTFLLFTLPIAPNRCIDLASLGADASDVEALRSGDMLAALDKAKFIVHGTSHRKIAGLDATCYQTTASVTDSETGDDTSAEVEYCFSSDGLQLSVRGTGEDESGQSTFTMEATSVSSSVVDADFTLPYPLAKTFELKVENDTDEQIHVSGNARGGGPTDGMMEIDAHKTDVLHTGLLGDPQSIEIGAYSVPQWYFTCEWDDAKAHEPVVVTVTFEPGANGTTRPVPGANCSLERVSPAAPPPARDAQAIGD